MVSETIDKILKIESKYDVKSITQGGIQIWSQLRIYLYFSCIKNAISTAPTLPLKNVVSSLLWMRFKLWKNYNTWVFSSSDQRKQLNEKWFDRADVVDNLRCNALFFELPNPRHAKGKSISSRNYVSRVWLIILERAIEKVLKFIPIKEDLTIISRIKSDLDAPLDLPTLYRRNLAKEMAVKAFFRIFGVPKYVFITSSYSNLPYVKAFKSNNAKVVEFQHGVISDSHLGYVSNFLAPKILLPDYLLTYGKKEVEIFSKTKLSERFNVMDIGHFYTDYVFEWSRDKNNDNRGNLRIAVTAQDVLGEDFISFLNSLVNAAKDIELILIPRHRPFSWYVSHGLSNKIVSGEGVDTYKTIALSDWHSTVYSSCAEEAIALGIPNVLINLEGMSEKYFGNLRYPNTSTWIANTPEDFIKIINETSLMPRDDIRKKASFSPGFNTNLNKFVKDLGYE